MYYSRVGQFTMWFGLVSSCLNHSACRTAEHFTGAVWFSWAMTLLLHHDKTYPVRRAETQYRSKDWIPIFSLSGSSMGATAGLIELGKSLTDLCAGLHIIFHVSL